MFRFAEDRPHRKPSLTPMIDVVFLLLVFFMLAARFGQDMELPLTTAGKGAPYQGPPRLVEVTTGGVALNGLALTLERLVPALAPLMRNNDDTVMIRPDDAATLQDLVAVVDALTAAGFSQLVIVEARP
jgi:biopolymer transport protein ExbD